MQCNISVTDAQVKILQSMLFLLLNISQKASIIWPKRLQFTNAGKLGLMHVLHKYLMWFHQLRLWLHDLFKPVEVRCHWTSVTLQNFFFFFSQYIKPRHLLDKSFKLRCLGCNRALGCPAFHLYWASVCWLAELSKRLDLFLIHSIHFLGSEFSIGMWSRDVRQAGAHSHLFSSDDLQFMFVPFCT